MLYSMLQNNQDDDLCGVLKLFIVSTPCGRAKTSVHVPLAFGLPPGPRPSFGGELGWPNYGPNRLGRSVNLRALPFFLVQQAAGAGVSPCRVGVSV